MAPRVPGGRLHRARAPDTPITTGPFICDVAFDVIQGGNQYSIELTDQNVPNGICGALLVPRTVYVAPYGAAYNPEQAFTLVFDGSSSGFQSLEVPAAGSLAPAPPSVTVVAIACTTCHSGQVVGYNMNLTNPGPPTLIELKGGARFPDGSILPLVNTTMTLASGPSTFVLVPTQALPGGLPTVDLLVEAAILEPSLGVTLSRHNVTLDLLP